jgi:hypothetical protein
MWIWQGVLHELGFRRRSERYWQCERGHGLGATEHLSLFPWSECGPEGGARLIELNTFHVTFVLEGEHLHFYYHEGHDNDWEPGGHTSSREIRRIGHNPRALRRRADAVASALVAALGGEMLPRGFSRRARGRGAGPPGR